jgi:hypothetical protein
MTAAQVAAAGTWQPDYWSGPQHGRTRIADVALRSFPELVALALAGLERDPTLVGILLRLDTQAFVLSLQACVRAAGGDASLVALSNPAVIADLQAEADKWAAKIIDTFGKDLLRFVAEAEAQGATEAELPGLIAQWNLQRSAWKDAQIAITESARSAGLAQRQFIDRSYATGKAYFGNSLQCDICQDVAAECPLPLDDERVGDIMHPNELDWWTIEYDPVEEPWTGQ